MNIFPYEVKRAHWSMNTAARNEFARICKEEKVPELKWMTPGRYDVLHVMAEYKWWLREPGRRSMPTMPLPMADLIKLLGLHPSTVSRTVSMMVTRELVRKYRNPHDEREVLIVFRKEGWAALRAARAIFRRRPQNFLRARIGEWFGQIAFPDTLESLRAMQDIMKRLASTFGLHSHPIHDVRCDLLREGLMWPTPHVYVRGRFRLPMPRSRRQTFG